MIARLSAVMSGPYKHGRSREWYETNDLERVEILLRDYLKNYDLVEMIQNEEQELFDVIIR